MKKLNEYITEGAVKDTFKKLFDKVKELIKGEKYFENKIKLSAKLFGDLKRNEPKGIVVARSIEYHWEEIFEIWHVYYDEDKYGDKKAVLELLGEYDGDKEELEYKESLKQYIDKKYFEEK